jgi:hypothetical protein
MASLGKGVFDILVNTAALKGASSAVRSAMGSMGSAVKGVGAIGAAAFAGLSIALKSSLDSFLEAEEASAKLSAVLRATGNAAGFTKQQLDAQASSFEAITKFSDDAITSMQAVLSTFSEVRGDQFVAAQKAAMDLSTVLGTDLQSAAIMVGKALTDPEQGLTALSRAGIQFSDAQKETIKTMLEANNVLGAQSLILDQINGKVGGASVEAANTLGGAIAQLTNMWDNMKESIGEAVGPALQEIIALIKDLVPAIGAGLTGALKGGIEAFMEMTHWVIELFGGLEEFKKTFAGVATFVGNITKVIQSAFLTMVSGVLQAVDTLAGGVVRGLGAVLEQVGKVEAALGMKERAGGIGKDLSSFSIGKDLLAGVQAARDELNDQIVNSMAEAIADTQTVKPKIDKNAFKADLEKVNAPRLSGGAGGSEKKASFMDSDALFKSVASNLFGADPGLMEAKRTNTTLDSMLTKLDQQLGVLNKLAGMPGTNLVG